MTSEKNNPYGIHVGMNISIGALQKHPIKTKKVRNTEDLQLGTMEYFHGISPQSRFMDEKYFDQWQEKQVHYKKRLSNIRKKRIERTKVAFEYEHNRLLSLCGPEWYQELSPQQKEIIDNLSNTIKKDLASHLTTITQSSLSLLGMRPLPNDSQLWRALIRSYGCPIEFLLMLYELIEPQRKHYSINDRLLLSGVAHLSLRHTLREMHVRFPSPPRVETKPVTPKSEPPKKKYPHTYLIPFTFKWPIRSRNIYKNPVIQKPECPYFSYVCDMLKERLICFDDFHQPQRGDEDIKIPCELFDDHLKAEELYNSVFARDDRCKYMIIRPNIYQRSTPKIYPGVLPQYMLRKKYPIPIKLFFDVKIYDEINSKNNKRRKVMRTICEAKKIPVGRPGQKMGHPSIAKYVYLRNLGPYFKDNVDSNISEEDSEEFVDYPCSVCGGPDHKQPQSEVRPQRVKTYIKKNKKPKVKRIYKDWSSSESLQASDKKKEVVYMDQEAKQLKRENIKYFETWKNCFANIENLEKLRLETKECVCPDKTRNISKTEPENDCTCAIWNLPPTPQMISPPVSCECNPKIEQSLEKEQCDCKKKARERAMEACARCGVVSLGANKKKDTESYCDCTKNGCGNCVKKTEHFGDGQEFTVAYVFIQNQLPSPEATNPKTEIIKDSIEKCCACEKLHGPTTNVKKESDITNERGRKLGKKCNISYGKKKTEKPNIKITQCLSTCENFVKIDHCERETQKLLKLLKCSCSKCKDLRKKYRLKYIHAGTRDACGGIIPIIGGTFGSYNECDCLKKFEERVNGINDYKKRMEAKLKLKSCKYRYIINGVSQTKMGLVYNISGIIPEYNVHRHCRDCICDNEQDKTAKQEKQDMLKEKIKKGYKYIISGVKGDSTSNEYILGAIIKECQCSKVFEQFMEEHNECLVIYEKYLQYMKKEIQEFTKEMTEKYGDLPLTSRELLDAEIRRLKGHPGLPELKGTSEFVVSGVKVNDLEKSFVLGGIRPVQIESEECIMATQSYTDLSDTEGISKCQRTYLCNYMTFGRDCGSPFLTTNGTELNNSSEELICQCISYESLQSTSCLEEEHKENEDEASEECACECPCGVQEDELSEECSCEDDGTMVCPESSDSEEQDIEVLEDCTCMDVEVKSSTSSSEPCLCGVKNCGCQIDEVCVKECFYGPMEAWWSDTDLKKKRSKKEEKKKKKIMKATSMSSIGGSSERYVILKEVPRGERKQEEIIKKLLRGLAIDGFPLANLPDCHKIPYFSLWLQFRMKKQWGYDDGVKNFRTCQRLWNHISLCKRKVPLLKLPTKFKTKKFTWKDAEIVAKMTDNIKQKYYNRLRKSMVDFAREFYITLSPYQFPRPPYLNHYFFAYQPSKLENVIAEHVWQPEECKDPRHRISCFCK